MERDCKTKLFFRNWWTIKSCRSTDTVYIPLLVSVIIYYSLNYLINTVRLKSNSSYHWYRKWYLLAQISHQKNKHRNRYELDNNEVSESSFWKSDINLLKDDSYFGDALYQKSKVVANEKERPLNSKQNNAVNTFNPYQSRSQVSYLC